MAIIEINTTDSKPSGAGVLLLALGSNVYGKMAVNLAIGLKHKNPDLRIALVYDLAALEDITEAQKFLFDIKVPCPADYCFIGGNPCYVRPKVYLDKLTPFEQTLFLDADMIWSPYHYPKQVMQELSELEFTMANRGKTNGAGASEWVNVELMRKNFEVSEWLDLSSEWVFFRQSERTTRLFERAREVYDSPKMICKGFAGGKPDEPAFVVAMLKTGLMPHMMPYYPTYWEPTHGYKKGADIWKDYKALSLGGRHISNRIKAEANRITKHYQYHMGIPVFDSISKFRFLETRQLI